MTHIHSSLLTPHSPLLTFALSLAVVLAVASCGKSEEERRQISRAERARLAREYRAAFKVAVLPTLDCLPIFLAEERGWWGTEDIRLLRRTAQMDCDTAVAGGSVEALVTDSVRLARMRASGLALADAGATGAYWLLMASRTARVRKVAQLGDKMVAMTRYSVTDHLQQQALRGVKTSSDVFSVQINDVMVRQRMLCAAEMDAAWLTEPQATAARLAGCVKVADSRQYVAPPGRVALHPSTLRSAERRAQLRAFIAGYNRAADSLSRYGLAAYMPLIVSQMHVTEQTVRSIPRQSFPHIQMPAAKTPAPPAAKR